MCSVYVVVSGLCMRLLYFVHVCVCCRSYGNVICVRSCSSAGRIYPLASNTNINNIQITQNGKSIHNRQQHETHIYP